MKTKWMVIPAIALLFYGCAGMEKPRIHKAGEDTFFVEVEEFNLTNAHVQELEGASGGKVVVLDDESGKAEATIKLCKGNYKITVYGLGPSPDEDAFFLKVGDKAAQRMWMESPGDIVPTPESVTFNQEADGPCNISLSFAEPNVQLDRVQFERVQ
jgi:hypothetical protein